MIVAKKNSWLQIQTVPQLFPLKPFFAALSAAKDGSSKDSDVTVVFTFEQFICFGFSDQSVQRQYSLATLFTRIGS